MTIDYGYRPFSPRLQHVDPVAVDGLKSHDGIEPQRNVASNGREKNIKLVNMISMGKYNMDIDG